MRVINGIDEIKQMAGQEIGVGSWTLIDQDRVNRFAEVTGDDQWIHTDPERAKASPFGGTIVHGYLTLSLLPALMAEIVRFDGFRAVINYGLERVRFAAPVPVGSRIRVRIGIKSVGRAPGGVRTAFEATMELEGSTKPAAVIEPIVLFLG